MAAVLVVIFNPFEVHKRRRHRISSTMRRQVSHDIHGGEEPRSDSEYIMEHAALEEMETEPAALDASPAEVPVISNPSGANTEASDLKDGTSHLKTTTAKLNAATSSLNTILPYSNTEPSYSNTELPDLEEVPTFLKTEPSDLNIAPADSHVSKRYAEVDPQFNEAKQASETDRVSVHLGSLSTSASMSSALWRYSEAQQPSREGLSSCSEHSQGSLGAPSLHSSVSDIDANSILSGNSGRDSINSAPLHTFSSEEYEENTTTPRESRGSTDDSVLSPRDIGADDAHSSSQALLFSRRQLGSEEHMGLSTIWHTVGSWMGGEAVQEEDEEDKYEWDGWEAVLYPDEVSGSDVSDSATSSVEQEQHNDTAVDVTFTETTEGSAHTEPPLPGAVEGSSLNGPPNEPKVYVHLCGQPSPILWTPYSAPQPSGIPADWESSEAKEVEEIDPRFLHVRHPNGEESDEALDPPPSRRYFEELYNGIETWFFDTKAGHVGTDGDNAAFSSESSEEKTEAESRLLARVSSFLVGSGREEEQGHVSAATPYGGQEGAPQEGALHGAEGEAQQPEGVEGVLPQPEAERQTSVEEPIATSTAEGNEEAGMHATRIKPNLSHSRWRSSSPDRGHQVIRHRSRKADKAPRTGFSGKPEDTHKIDTFSAPAEPAEDSKSVDRGGFKAAEEPERGRKINDQELGVPQEETDKCGERLHGPGELTSEEAAAKEAAARSLGNRIWAFFGGGTAEGGGAGSEGPTSGDPVEETVPFEDPAIVQRDDHRAYPSETKHLIECVGQQPLLQVLSPQQQKYVASLMRREVFGASTTIVEEGAEPALMWCSSGEFDVTQAGFFGVSVLRTLTPGEFFGVEELVAGEKLKCALASKQSASECALWILDRELYLDSVKDMHAKRVAFVPVAENFLHKVPLVRDLPEDQLAAVAKACKVEKFAEGQTVFKMGFHGDMLCFIYRGEAITQKPQDDGGLLELARQGRGEYFGEMALIRNARRTASVVAGTELLLLCLDKDSFEALLSPLKEKMAAKAASSYKRQEDAPPTETDARGANVAPVPGSRDAGESCVKKRTRKSSLALLNYSKIKEQDKHEDGQADVPEDKSTSRWRLAQEPTTIFSPPPLSRPGGRSCLKGEGKDGRSRTRKSPVRFDEDSLLPSESSSDGD